MQILQKHFKNLSIILLGILLGSIISTNITQAAWNSWFTKTEAEKSVAEDDAQGCKSSTSGTETGQDGSCDQVLSCIETNQYTVHKNILMIQKEIGIIIFISGNILSL